MNVIAFNVTCLRTFKYEHMCTVLHSLCQPAGDRGARVSACAGLTNELLSCWVDPRSAWKNTNTAIVGDRWRGCWDTTPCTVNWCKKVPSGVTD